MTQTVGLVFGQQVRDVRKRRGWDRDRLAAEVNRTAGTSWPGTTVTKIERGTRRVDLDELLTLALVLGVAPVHLLAPREDAAAVIVGGTEVPAPRLRAFVRGHRPLQGQPERVFYSEVPDTEYGAPSRRTDAAYAEAERLRAAGDVDGAVAVEQAADALFEREQDTAFDSHRPATDVPYGEPHDVPRTVRRADDPDRLDDARRLLAASLRLVETLSPVDLQRLIDEPDTPAMTRPDDEGDAR